MNAPKISLIMACYNGRKWLPEAIGSILSQTFPDFEVIFIDDGSTDNSLEYMSTLARTEPRITCIGKKNTGLPDSLNVGLKVAKGEWIARLDCDDLCSPDRFEQQLSYLDRHRDVVLLGSSFCELAASGAKVKSHAVPEKKSAIVKHIKSLRLSFPHSSVLFKRTVAMALGGYSLRFPRSQDTRLWLQFSRNHEVRSLDRELVSIRMHPSQISHSRGPEKQLTYGVAAIVAEFLWEETGVDYVEAASNTDWAAFVIWIGEEVEAMGISERRDRVRKVRGALYNGNMFRRSGLLAVVDMIRSGDLTETILERMRGSVAPATIARRCNCFVRS